MEVEFPTQSASNILCKVGALLSSSCIGKNLTSKQNLFLIKEDLDEKEFELLLWRTGFQDYDKEDTICSHHKYYFLSYFEHLQTSCCDPYKRHKKPITNKKNLRKITIEKAKLYKENKNINLIPGYLLCSSCRKTLSEGNEEKEDESEETDIEKNDVDLKLVSRQIEKARMNESLEAIDVSPIKLKSVSSHSKKSYAKRKLKQVESKIKKKLSTVLSVNEFESDDSESDTEKRDKLEEMKVKCADLEKLVELIKIKLTSGLNKRETIQVLTLAPQSWSRKRVATEFNVSEYMARKAREMTIEKGILAIPGPRKGSKLSSEVLEKVKLFYEDDGNSIMMPGVKDRVSIQKNEYQQKRLLLCNLKELYCQFKQTYPGLGIGFSTFCSLRPKWCVLAGSPGTHAVCVCAIHQNVYLLAAALNLHKKKEIHNLMNKIVCNSDSRDCMLRCCTNCVNNSQPLRNYLKDLLIDYDDCDEVQFSQWINEDRMKLQTISLPVEEFLDLFIEKVLNLIPHSYISRTQNTYLKMRKENLKDDECLVLMDFAENYNFVLQNEVQSYHWSHLSCTLHPTVIFAKTSSGLKEFSLCFISDDLNHDVPFVYGVQQKTIEFIRNHVPHINTIEYFTDGCSAQYKNFKSMMNLCNHKEDFQMDACWSFHATSHGKTVCDGIGGTVKRIVTKKNLQSVHQSFQITNAHQMYTYCKGLRSNISFFFLGESEINNYRSKLEERFLKGKTITGTRSFHYFRPSSINEIMAKRTSLDPEVCITWNITKGAQCSRLLKHLEPSIQNYVVCVYEDNWWIGMVSKINKEEGDYTIAFMHPHGPSDTFYWPERQDECPVPPQHILSIIKAPLMTSQTGRLYKIEEDVKQTISQAWNTFIRNN